MRSKRGDLFPKPHLWSQLLSIESAILANVPKKRPIESGAHDEQILVCLFQNNKKWGDHSFKGEFFCTIYWNSKPLQKVYRFLRSFTPFEWIISRLTLSSTAIALLTHMSFKWIEPCHFHTLNKILMDKDMQNGLVMHRYERTSQDRVYHSLTYSCNYCMSYICINITQKDPLNLFSLMD